MANSPAHPLAGCEAKLIRADEHLKALDAQIPSFLKTNPHEYRGHIQGQLGGVGRYSATVHIKKELPIEWSVIVGDVIHNLRSALDQLVWQLVILNGHTPNGGPGGNQFPIFTTKPGDLRTSKSSFNRQLRGVHRSVRAVIQRIQPYHKTSEVDAHPLAALTQLSNEDKHQAILRSYSAIAVKPFEDDDPPFRLTTNDVAPIERFEVHVNKPLEDGAEICAADIKITGPNPEVELEGSLPFDVAFGESMVTMPGLVRIREAVHSIFLGLRSLFP